MPNDTFTLQIFDSGISIPATHAGSHLAGGTDAIPAATSAASGLMSAAQAVQLEANNAKVSNATHTGDVTGSGALTIASGAVTQDKILDGAVTGSKLAADSVSATKIVNGSVSLAKVQDVGGLTVLGRSASSSGPPSAVSCSALGFSLIAGVDAAAMRSTLGLGALATEDSTSINLATDAGSSILSVTNGGTGRATGTTPYSLLATGVSATGVQQTLPSGAVDQLLVGGGATALPAWTTATGTGAPVRATSPTLVTPALGVPSSGTLTNCTGLPIAAGTTGTLPASRLPLPTTTELGGVKRNIGTAGQIVSGISSDGDLIYVDAPTGGTGTGDGTVTSFTFTEENGFVGTVSTATTTPTLSLKVSPSLGILKGTSTGTVVSAVSGTDFLPPAGASSITTLGTVATGVWSATEIAVAKGGTGATDATTARTNLSVPSLTGTGASGTWGVSVSGNAATATTLETARDISLSGDVSGTASFNGSANATISGTVVSASDTVAGKIELATQAEVDTGTDTVRAVTPATVASRYVKKNGDTMTGQLVVRDVALSRNDTASEGGQINFHRPFDDTAAWSIDQFGPNSTDGGSLRFIERTGTVSTALSLSKTAATFNVPVTATSFIGSLTGNASTVTNGVVTTSTYADPSWILSLAASKLTGTIPIASGGTGATTASAAVTNLTTVETRAGTAITLVSADSGKILRTTEATAVTITIPNGLAANFSVMVIQGGAGAITFSGASTIQSFGGLVKTAGLHAAANIIRVSTDTYNLSGNLV